MARVIKLSSPQEASMSNDWYGLTELNHFWLKWRFKIIYQELKPILNKKVKILEIGCGNGVVMKQFHNQLSISIDGCDINSFALDSINYKLSGNVYQYDIFDLHPMLIGKYDIVLLLDVIEHIDNVNEFLSAALKHLKENGILVVSVPAHQWLFSDYDIQDGHKRRYNLMQIKQLFTDQNLDVINAKYWGLFMLPLVIIRKYYLVLNPKNAVKKGFSIPHPLFNKLALQIMNLETEYINHPISGSSVFAIGRKKTQV